MLAEPTLVLDPADLRRLPNATRTLTPPRSARTGKGQIRALLGTAAHFCKARRPPGCDAPGAFSSPEQSSQTQSVTEPLSPNRNLNTMYRPHQVQSGGAVPESDRCRTVGGYAARAALVDGWVACPRMRFCSGPRALGLVEVSHVAQEDVPLGVAQHCLLVLALQDAHACSNHSRRLAWGTEVSTHTKKPDASFESC